MDEKKYINPDKPVYISYAWGEDLEFDVNKLCELMDANGILFRRDKSQGANSQCPYRYNIIDAEEEIGKGDIIIVVLSKNYIRSLNCMYEWHCICEAGDIAKRVFPIVLPDTKLRQEYRYNAYKKYFETRLQKLSDKDVVAPFSINKIERNLLDNDGYFKDLETLRNYLDEHNIPDLEALREDNYSVIIQQLKEHVTANAGSKVKREETINTSSSAPSFRFTSQSNLVDRNVEPLHELVKRNKFSNLFGFGGSGKTSLTYLFLQKYRSEFNQVAYVVVNNDIKADIVSQINDTIHLFEPEECPQRDAGIIQDVTKNREKTDQYRSVITFLESNYISDKPNLLIIDINNTLDGGLAEYTEELANNTLPSNKIYPDGWKILIVSRQECKSLAKIDLNKDEKENTAFLKELFLKNAGEKYHVFSDDDFSQLFATLYYSPLLAEQLGIYLQDLPVKSVSQISDILRMDSFKNETRVGITAHNRSSNEKKTIVDFLRKIVVYNAFKENEKILLKHFVLWPTDFIPLNVIFGFLEGLFNSKKELEDVLIRLVQRRIIAIQEADGVSKYKLHGLLAESLREQIDISNEDYSKYLANIDRIIELSYYAFLPYADCIGNSLCKYDNTSFNIYILFDSALKLHETRASNYAEALYLKCIRKTNGTDPWERNLLASAYNNLASLQSDQLGEYESAESNYKKAIAIYELLPKDNPEYQNDLANAYNNIAIFQSNQLGEYKSAESNYKKAIGICERLPQGNPEYQNDLANAYNNLASLQSDQLGEYKSAESNYKKAIEIGERLPKDNPEYRNDLANAYNNLASLQSDQLGEYKSAESNYKKAIEIGERLPKDSPEYQNALVSAYNNLALLQSDQLGEYKSAESNYKKAIGIGERLPKDYPEYQNALVSAYNNLALLQSDQLGEYKSAESNYKKAIGIGERLPKDYPEYQSSLARAYNNLANLQSGQLGEYKSAESNYKKAIGICERLPKNNPEYQNDLARAYDNLALLQRNQLGKYESAESNYKKAIAIYEHNNNAEWPIAPTFLSLRKGCTEDTANYNTDGIYYTDYIRGFLADLSHDPNIQNALSLFQFVPENFLPHDPNAENPNEITTKPTKATVIWNDPLDPKITEILERKGKKIIRIDSGTYANNGRLCDAFRKCNSEHTSFCFKQDSIVGIFADEELNKLQPNSDKYRKKLEKLVAEFNQNRAEISKIKCNAFSKEGKTKRLYIHYTCPFSLFEEHIFPIYVQGRIIACLMFGQVARDAFDKKKAFHEFENIMQIYIDFHDEIDNVKTVDNELWNEKVDTIINRIETFEKRLENRIDHRNTLYINYGFREIEQQFRKGIRRIRIKGYNAISEFIEASNIAFNKIREKFGGSDDGFFRMFALPITTIQKELILVGWSGEISPEERKEYKFSLKQLIGLDNIKDEDDKKKSEIILNGASQQIKKAYNDKDVFWYGTLANNEVAYIVWKRHDQQLHEAAFKIYRNALKNFYSVVLECYSYIRCAKMELLLETTIQQSAHESAHFIEPARDMVENNLRFPSERDYLDHYSTYKKYFDIEKQSILALLNQLAEINNGSSLIFSEEITIKKQPQNVHDLLMNLKRMFSKKSADYNKDIHYVEEKRFVIANIDVAYFNHALYNLVDNAVKYASDGSNIYINMDVDRTERKLKIQFKSFGIQIKEEDREKIYHLFERGEDAALSTRGTGIGMYIVKKVCEAHGGNVSHSSEILSEYNIPILFNFKYNNNLRKRINLGKMVEFDKMYGKEINRLSGLIENEVVHNHNFVKNLITFNSRINTPTYRNIFFVEIPLK